MATQFVHDDRNVRTTRALGTGSVVEAVAAAAAVALTIIGLAGAAPVFLAAVATIVLGAALVMEGGGVATRHHLGHHEAYTRTTEGSPGFRREETVARTPGTSYSTEGAAARTSAESIAGIAGVVLGILSIINVAPRVLLPISLIVFGGGLIMGGGGEGVEGGGVHRVAGTGHVFVGVGAVVLGILSLIGVEPLTLVLVGLLAIGTAIFFSSTTWGARLFHHRHVTG